MKSTYREALKAGFSKQRARFLSRMCSDTKDTVQKRMEKRFYLKKKPTGAEQRRLDKGSGDDLKELSSCLIGLFACVGVLCIGGFAVVGILHIGFGWQYIG
jgi:hypothetical protein